MGLGNKKQTEPKAGSTYNQTDVLNQTKDSPERKEQFSKEQTDASNVAKEELEKQLDAPISNEPENQLKEIEIPKEEKVIPKVEETIIENPKSRLEEINDFLEFEIVSENWDYVQPRKMKDGESIIAEFVDLDASTLHPKIENGMIFKDYKTGRKLVVPNNYQLRKYFEEKGSQGTIYKLTKVREQPDAGKGGGSVMVWEIAAAKPK